MKTYKHLYPQVCDFENLYLAWRKARKGKRGRDEKILKVSETFRIYQRQKCSPFTDGSRGKRRHILSPSRRGRF